MREGDEPARREPRARGHGQPDERANEKRGEPSDKSIVELPRAAERGCGEPLDESAEPGCGEPLDESADRRCGVRPNESAFRGCSQPLDERVGDAIGWLMRDGSHVGVALRSSRRRLRWNQRELARRAGLSQSTIARLEAGADARFSVVVTALSACGLELLAAPPPGAPSDWRVVPDPMDDGRDTAGHRLPAHLPAYPTDILPTYTLWKRMVRHEDLIRKRPRHWLYAYEPWRVPPDPPDRDPPLDGASG